MSNRGPYRPVRVGGKGAKSYTAYLPAYLGTLADGWGPGAAYASSQAALLQLVARLQRVSCLCAVTSQARNRTRQQFGSELATLLEARR